MSKLGSLFRVLFIRVPYYSGEPKRTLIFRELPLSHFDFRALQIKRLLSMGSQGLAKGLGQHCSTLLFLEILHYLKDPKLWDLSFSG